MFNKNMVLILFSAFLTTSGTSFAQSSNVTFHVNDSRDNETDLCMFHRTNILNVKICNSDNGNDIFQFDMSSKRGPIQQGADKCMGFNKARVDNWSVGKKLSMVDCNDSNFHSITWNASSDGKVFSATNDQGKKFCLAISSRSNQSIAFGDCGDSSTLPKWRLVSSN